MGRRKEEGGFDAFERGSVRGGRKEVVKMRQSCHVKFVLERADN